MAYIALYRKYRSQNFDELMGQEQVTTTLQNAIRSGRIAHAYLFHGARGCGKTSTARLLSRALNCVAQDGPSPTPCGVCRLCVSIRENTCMDVVEIDAASETGVDNVREKIIENVQYAASEARYKVYIIDEVHDLSAKAFDALLKTLEEPPPHVVFILATTEYHKVPITIRSRCQGYQFKRGSLHDLGAAVERVITAEGFTAEPEAIQAVARSAEGSWRDALSILEQVLAYSDGHVTAAIVHRALGTVGTEMLAQVTETLAGGQWNETLGIASDLVDSGTDVRQLLTALAGHLRDLMLLATGAKQAAAQELGADRLNLLKPQATLFAPAALLDMMGELSAAERECRNSNQHRWILERTLVRLMQTGQGLAASVPQPTVATLPQNAVPAITRPPQRPTVTPVAASESDERNGAASLPDSSSGSPAISPSTSAAMAASAPSVVPRPPTQHTTQTFATTSAAASLNAMEATDAEEEEEEGAAEPDEETLPTTPLTFAPDTKPADFILPPLVPSGTTPAGNGTGEPTTPAPAVSKHQFAEGVTLEVIQRAWPRILKLVEKQSPSGANFLQKAQVSGLDGHTILLSFKEAYARDRIQNKGKELVEKKVNEGLQTEGYRIQCLLEGQNGSGGAGLAAALPTGPPTNGSGMAAVQEMATLLDSPPVSTAPAGPSRVMDFEVPAAAPPPAYETPRVENTYTAPAPVSSRTNGNGTQGDQAAPAPVPPPDPGRGMLKEALDIFGGQVISTENA